MGSSGKPIKHAELIRALFNSLHLPKKVAILKVKAHTREKILESKGNAFADTAAKQVALMTPPAVYLAEVTEGARLDVTTLLVFQQQAPEK